MNQKNKKSPETPDSFAQKLIASGIFDEVARLQQQGKALGLFVENRDLLECPKCHLFEDVMCDGKLLVTTEENPDTDSGLRFEDVAKDKYRCPACGKIFKTKHNKG